MASAPWERRTPEPYGEWARPENVVHDPSIGQLFSRLSQDASHLMRSEVALAKLELRETMTVVRRDAIRVGVALILAWMGGLALTAALVVGLGALLGNYWLAALIVGVLFAVIGAVLVSRATKDLKESGLKPEATLETLRADADWAKREAQEFKRDLLA